MSLTVILTAIIAILTGVAGILGVTTVREKSKRAIAEKERDSANQNQLDSLEVQRIKEENVYVKPEDNDGRNGVGGPRA